MNSFRRINLFFLIISLYLINISINSKAESFKSKNSNDNKLLNSIIIKSKSMDLYVKDNKISLNGEVIIEDNKYKLIADKIEIFFEDTFNKNKALKNIIAVGHVEIIKKVSVIKDNINYKIKAIAGKANYNLKTGMIILTDNPILFYGNCQLRGYLVTIWKDNERIKVDKNKVTEKRNRLVVPLVNFPN